MSEELLQKVKKLEADLIQEKQKNKKLELSLRLTIDELSQFAYMASHDLQEPLRMIASYLQLLQKRYAEKLDSTANEFIGFAVDGSRRMKALIDALLEYSRTGTQENHWESINVTELLTELKHGMAHSLEKNNIALDIKELPVIKGDYQQLKQVFHHLLENAMKFKSGERQIKITIEGEERKEDYLFSVKDNGIGIEKESWERIFVIFQKLHSRDEYSGTGIGLAVCKRIIEKHKGKIWVESEKGKGSVFYFTVGKDLKSD